MKEKCRDCYFWWNYQVDEHGVDRKTVSEFSTGECRRHAPRAPLQITIGVTVAPTSAIYPGVCPTNGCGDFRAAE